MSPRRPRRGTLGRRARPGSASPRELRVLVTLLALASGFVAAQEPPGAVPSVRRLRALPADAVALLLEGRVGGDLPAEIVLEESAPAASGTRSIELRVDVSRADLGAPSGSAPSVELYLYALGPGRHVRGHLAERHLVEPAAEARDDVVSIRMNVAGVPAGDRVRVLVREVGSPRFALRELATSSVEASADPHAAAAGPAGAAGNGRRGDRGAAKGTAGRAREESTAASGRSRAKVELLARAYRDVLRAYAAGARGSAIEDLRGFESDALGDAGDDPAKRVAALAEAETLVAQRLAEREPDSLVPLLLLHLEAHDRYVTARDLRLASHSTDRVEAIAELYARTAQSQTAAQLASDAMEAIGCYLQSARQRTAGHKLLGRAVELDPGNLEARLCIALAYEVQGEYENALAALDALSSFGSFDDEVRLRRATVERRLGRLDEAAAAYERLIAASREDWIVIVAYQELARVHLERDRPSAAVATLAPATRRFPADSTLRIQLAYALDRDGAREQSGRTLDAVVAPGSEPGAATPPRSRYQQGLDRVARRSELLARSGLALLPVLAAALDSIAGGAVAGGG